MDLENGIQSRASDSTEHLSKISDLFRPTLMMVLGRPMNAIEGHQESCSSGPCSKEKVILLETILILISLETIMIFKLILYFKISLDWTPSSHYTKNKSPKTHTYTNSKGFLNLHMSRPSQHNNEKKSSNQCSVADSNTTDIL